jgi:hypothetical protein
VSDLRTPHSARAAPPAEPKREAFRYWFGFLGAIAAYVAHFSLLYVLTEVDCASDRLAYLVFGVPLIHLLVIVLAALALGVAVAAGISVWRAPVPEPQEPAGRLERLGRRAFMAYSGTVLSILFGLAILSSALPFLFLRTCT